MLYFGILKTFINLNKNILTLWFILTLYYFKNYKMHSDLIFLGKFILDVIFKTNGKKLVEKIIKKTNNKLLFEA